jgi:hypothetical protein
LTHQPILSEEEWSLILELLQRESDELPSEIHHCRVTNFREDLRRRQEMIHHLMERLRAPATV